jgi:hypothetical protein
MKTHVIHDADGTIKSVVFQSAELQGELEIVPEGSGDTVTTVDLEEVAPGRKGGPLSSRDLSELGHEIRTGFEVDKDGGRLRKLNA